MRAALLILTALLCATPCRSARAGDGPDAAESTRRVILLRERVRRWVEARQLPAVSNCRSCGGEGVRHRIDRDARGNVIAKYDEICAQCEGRKTFLDWARARSAHWDFKTPAFRASASNESAFKAMASGWMTRPADEPVLRGYRIGDIRLTGERFGVVELFENGEKLPQQARWIWLESGKGRSWYLYSEATDGIWDGTPRPTPAPPTPAPPRLEPSSGRTSTPPSSGLGEEQAALMKKSFAAHSVKGTLSSGERATSELVVRVRYAGITTEVDLQAAIEADVIPAMKAVMLADSTAPSVAVEFLTCYRDKLGSVALRPYETVRMERATYAKIHFENLELDEALRLFRRNRPSYALDEVILWWKGSCGAGDSTAPSPPLAPRSPSTSAPVPSDAVTDALRWLAAHQSPDGGWECEGWRKWSDGKPSDSGASLDGAGKAAYDVGVTGLALLAFLSAGYTHRSEGPFGKTVSDGLGYLRGAQDAEGCFGSRTTGHYVYNHAIAELAMLEAYDRTPGDVLKRSAQQGLSFSETARNPYFAWRYGVRPGDNDTSVTGWFAEGFFKARSINESAAVAGQSLPFVFAPAVFDGVRAWIDKMTDADTGRVGYQQRGTGPARPQELVDAFPAERSESMTAIGLLLRARAGERAAASASMRSGIERCLALLPVWSPSDGRIDMYYWHHATEALKVAGGAAWRDWRTRLVSVAQSSQRKDGAYGTYRGSWDAIDPWGVDGGRVYSTSMMTLCLEASKE